MPAKGVYCIAIFSWDGNITTEFEIFSGSIPVSMQGALLK